MKKRYLALPLALGVAGASWAGSTLYSGNEARAAYDRLLADASTATGFALVPDSYQAGFLQSEAVTELRLGGGATAGTLMRFRHVIEHSTLGDSGLRAGRIVTTADTSDLDARIAGKLAALFGGADPLTIESLIGLDGGILHTVTVAAWERDDETAVVASAPMVWTVTQPGTEEKTVSGTGVWPGLTLSSKTDVDVELTLGASRDRFDYRKADGELYVGDYLAELGDLNASSLSTGMSAALSGMRLSSGTAVVDEAYRGDAAFEIASMQLPIELDSLRLSGSFDGFPMAGVKRINEAMDTVNTAAFGENEAALEAAMGSYVAALGSMLEPGLSISYGLELANAGGRAVADFAMRWTGQNGMAGLETVGDAMRAVHATATLDADAEALAMTPVAATVDPARLEPWVTSAAGGYRADIVIENLIMDVNGQRMPLDAMLGPVLDRPLKELFGDAI